MWDLADREYGSHHTTYEGHIDLTTILEKNKIAEATEPKDMVFGVLGLLPHSPALDQRSSLLTPSYAKSLVEVYRDATLFAIQERGTLWVLRRLTHRGDEEPDLEGFPSWVPHYDRKGRKGSHPVQLGPNYTASKGLPMSKPTDTVINPDILLLHGISVSRITQSTSVMSAFQRAEAIGELLDTVEKLAYSVPTLGGNRKSEEAVAVTLVGGRSAQRKTANESEYLDYQSYKNYIRANRRNPPPPRKIEPDMDDETKAASRWHWAFVQAASYRRFFVTDTGLVGIGPRQTRKGDVVAILYGGIWPFVLRAYDDHHHLLLGATYVHGVMNGEAVDGHQASGASDTVFRLR